MFYAQFILYELFSIMTQKNTRLILRPHVYFGAATETLFAILVVSWVMTTIWTKYYIKSNSIRTEIGYNNVCVGWDDPPALYFAASTYPIVIYCITRFALLDNVIASKLVSNFLLLQIRRGINIIYCCSALASSLIFVVRPASCPYCVQPHTAFFIQFVLFQTIAMASVYLGSRPTRCQLIYIAILGAFTIIDFTLLVINMYNFYPNRPTPAVPPPLMGIFDYGWFALLGLNSIFLPAKYELVATVEVQETRFKYDFQRIISTPISTLTKF